VDAPWLTLVIFLPLVGVPVLLLWRTMPDDTARWIALAVSLAVFLVSLGMLANFDASTPGFQLVENVPWVRSIGLSYLVGVDGFSVWLVMITTFLIPISIAASWKVEQNVRLFMALALLTETVILGAFLALDLLLFFLFFEALLVPMYLIIGLWGSKRRIYAAVKFFLFTMFGSAFLLVAILILYFKATDQLGGGTFDLRQLEHLSLATTTARWLFSAFFVAFAVKVPLVPLHTWLPDAHTEAPTTGSVILAALLLKIGVYGILRFNLTLFPEASHYFATTVGVLAVIGIIYGAIVAMMQTDMKRLIAYSSVSHMGFVVLGIFAFTPEGMDGAVLQMVNHGLSTGMLFLVFGMLYERTHTREISELGGIAGATPVLAGAFVVAMLSSIGLPGLNNFVGEFLVLVGTFRSHLALGSVAVSGVVLGAIYMLWAYQRSFQGSARDAWSSLRDLTRREAAIVVPIVAVMLWIGLYPRPFLSRLESTSESVARRVRTVQVGGTTTRPLAFAPRPGEGGTP